MQKIINSLEKENVFISSIYDKNNSIINLIKQNIELSNKVKELEKQLQDTEKE